MKLWDLELIRSHWYPPYGFTLSFLLARIQPEGSPYIYPVYLFASHVNVDGNVIFIGILNIPIIKIRRKNGNNSTSTPAVKPSGV